MLDNYLHSKWRGFSAQPPPPAAEPCAYPPNWPHAYMLAMLAQVLAFALTLQLHKTDIFGPPTRPNLNSWTGGTEGRSVVSFKASDGTMLRGWLFATERRGAPFVLYFYGSNEDAQLEQKRMTWLSTVGGVNAVVFDYRGYGFSEGAIAPEAMRTDAVGAFDAVRQIAGGAPIILYGWSIGTTFAIHVAAERAAAGVLLQAPPASAAEMAAWSSQHDVPAAVRWAVNLTGDADYNATFRGAAEISRVKAPLLVIHGDKDEDVPLAQGQEVFANSPSTAKKFVIVPGGRHNDIRISLPPAAPAIMEFFKAVATEAGGSP